MNYIRGILDEKIDIWHWLEWLWLKNPVTPWCDSLIFSNDKHSIASLGYHLLSRKINPLEIEIKRERLPIFYWNQIYKSVNCSHIWPSILCAVRWPLIQWSMREKNWVKKKSIDILFRYGMVILDESTKQILVYHFSHAFEVKKIETNFF